MAPEFSGNIDRILIGDGVERLTQFEYDYFVVKIGKCMRLACVWVLRNLNETNHSFLGKARSGGDARSHAACGV